jgi:hypothetical protein
MGDNSGTVTRSIPKKSQTMREICQLLGISEMATTVGSSVPRVFFSDIATQMGSQTLGTMPLTARSIIEMSGLNWHDDFSSEQTPSGGGGTVTALGLLQVKNAVLVWLGRSPIPLPTDGQSEQWQPHENWKALRELLSTDTQEITIRPGASNFREIVLTEYDNLCAVSGFKVLNAIEVAHIVPYYGELSDEVQNAIPMRVDIHRLFDQGLIRVIFDDLKMKYIVLTHPEIMNDYQEFNGLELKVPKDPLARPSKLAIEIKNGLHDSIWGNR